MAKERKKDVAQEKSNVGLIMNVSLFLILLTFFVLFNSIAVIDDIKKRLALGSLVGAFGSFTGGLSAMKTGESVLPPSVPMLEQKVEMAELMTMLENRTKKDIKVISLKDRIKITFSEKSLFQENSSKLKPSADPLLSKLGKVIIEGKYRVEMIGHTDNMPGPEKGHASNWELSTLMALSVLRYLVEKEKVDPVRLTAYGRGEQEQISHNHTRGSRARNRRIDIILHNKAPSYMKRIFKEKPPGIFTYKRFDFRVF